MKKNRYGVLGAAALTVMTLSACDVTNPGPIQDAFVSDESAQVGLIFGAQRSIATAIGHDVFDMNLMSREVFPGGQTGAWGTNVANHAGNVQPEYGGGFTNYHSARFIAETAIARFTEAGASDARMYQAHLWAGWAYRILGEWWCDTVLPSTDPENRDPSEYIAGSTDDYFERAEASFTSALGFASTDAERDAAYAGRAQARMWLGNYSGALSDAQEVPSSFRQQIAQDPAETATYNYIAESNSGTFRSYTTRFTWFETYYDASGDPRVPSALDPDYPVAVGSLSGFGQVPYRPQLKFTSRTDDMNLASGWEMRLLEAEAILRGAGSGAFADAMTLINQVHTRNVSDLGGNLAALTAANAAEAMVHLKRERRIELWLEGRSAPDERRWDALGETTPDIPDWENPANPGYTDLFVDYPRDTRADYGRWLCFDIPASERDRNPNVPPAPTGS